MKKTKWEPIKTETMLRISAQGLSAQQVSNKMRDQGYEDVTRNAVIGKMGRLGEPLFNARGKKVKRKKMKAMVSKKIDKVHRERISAAQKTIQNILERSFKGQPGCKPFAETEPDECLWAADEAEDGTSLFCCRSVIDGKRYCLEHFRMAHKGPTAAHEKIATI